MSAVDYTNIFNEAIKQYHTTDNVNTTLQNPYSDGFSKILYHKNWIDTVQWHLEDLIREPKIEPAKALQLKRSIDELNQQRTDLVENIDAYFLQQYEHVIPQVGATWNTESPAWAIDRLSILALKIYHMAIEANRADATAAHRQISNEKLSILLQQQVDLQTAIDALLVDINSGKKVMKVYKQMKMYNDAAFNPVLYKQSN